MMNSNHISVDGYPLKLNFVCYYINISNVELHISKLRFCKQKYNYYPEFKLMVSGWPVFAKRNRCFRKLENAKKFISIINTLYI